MDIMEEEDFEEEEDDIRLSSSGRNLALGSEDHAAEETEESKSLENEHFDELIDENFEDPTDGLEIPADDFL